MLKSKPTVQAQPSYPEIIKFLRQTDYRFVEELGQGACGVTIKLFDEEIEENFACKKFRPIEGVDQDELFAKFLSEIKLLFSVGHKNVVRIFNYHVYRTSHTAYIIMEFVDGYDVMSYLKLHQDNVGDVFLQIISGFLHLESIGIIHRDIRPQNILVTRTGVPKIIDFGFGKRISSFSDFEKSISLNWPFRVPKEFRSGIYDFSTEVYFVGKLIEAAIENSDTFEYLPILNRMCEWDPVNRFKNFFEVNGEIAGEKFQLQFTDSEREIYRVFSAHIFSLVRKVDLSAKFCVDADNLALRLGDVFRKIMLEHYVPNPEAITSELIFGSYRYAKNYNIPTDALGDFVDLLRRASSAKRQIVLDNLRSKLASIEKIVPPPRLEGMDEDIPF